MLNENPKKCFSAYFDDSEGISDEGSIFTVIGGVLVRQDLLDEIEAKMVNIWNKYLPGIEISEFHAKDLEEATIWPFSTLKDSEPLRMQQEFIDLIGSTDLPAMAVTIDSSILASNSLIGETQKYLNSKDLAVSLAIAICSESLVYARNGENLKVTVDEGLINKKNRLTTEEAIRQLQSFGAKDFANIAREEGVIPPAAMDKFSVDANLPEVASHKLAGLQLADHVARYVFKYAKNPVAPDPRYSRLTKNGLEYHSWNSEGTNSFPGIVVHIRPRKGITLSYANRIGLESLETITSQFKTHLQDTFGIRRECQKCKTNLFWGLPSKDIQNVIDNGECKLVASSIKPKNYCPQCGSLVFTSTEYHEEVRRKINRNSDT